MDYDAGESQRIYKVVISDEEEYAIWLAEHPTAPGWDDADTSGSRAGCLAYIKDVWLDMRPLGPGRAIGIGTRKE